MATSTHQNQDQRPREGSPTSKTQQDHDGLQLAATVIAHTNIAVSALEDAYAILSNCDTNIIRSASMLIQMRHIRNRSRDIVALVENDLSTDARQNFQPIDITDEEMTVLYETFRQATDSDVPRSFFAESVHVWNPKRMKRRAQMILREREAVGSQPKREETLDGKILQRVRSRRFWTDLEAIIQARWKRQGERSATVGSARPSSAVPSASRSTEQPTDQPTEEPAEQSTEQPTQAQEQPMSATPANDPKTVITAKQKQMLYQVYIDQGGIDDFATYSAEVDRSEGGRLQWVLQKLESIRLDEID